MSAHADAEKERQLVAALDIQFQAAVKRNDADTMAKILHEKMVLVLGTGKVLTREEQLREATGKVVEYLVQDEEPGTQTVRIVGDTAVVTALLRIQGRRAGVNFERRVWFSDTYVRTAAGWKYFVGQASLPLPAATQ